MVIVTIEQSSEPVAVTNQFWIIPSLFVFPHSKVKLEGNERAGGVVSVMVYIPIVVTLFPQSSVAVNDIVIVVMPAQPDGNVPSQSLVHTTGPLQPSLALAPPLVPSHDRKFMVLSSIQFTIGLVAGVSIVGSVESTVLYVAVQLALLPASSVTINTYVDDEVPPQPFVCVSMKKSSVRSVSQLSAPTKVAAQVSISSIPHSTNN